MRVPGWLRKASGGRNSPTSTFAIQLRADKLTSKGALLPCGRYCSSFMTIRPMALQSPGTSNGRTRRVQAAVNYAKAFPEEIEEALSENSATDFVALKRMLPQATEFVSGRPPQK